LKKQKMGKRVDWLITQLKIVGGAETFVRYAAPRLCLDGWELRIITMVSGGVLVDELRHNNVPVLELGMKRKADTGALLRLIRLWKQDKPDILHTHLYHAGITGRIFGSWLKIKPIVVHQHGPEVERNRFHTWLDASTSPRVTQFIASCFAVSCTMQDREGIPSQKIKVIYNGIRIPNRFDTAKPIEWQEPEGSITIACVGRFIPEKGQEQLLDAMAILKSNGYSPHLVFFGDGPLLNHIKSQSQKYGLSSHVTYMGVRRDILEWLPHFDIFVLPSEWEGVSLALLEAMASRLPVIATAVGGTPEVVFDYESGILVPLGDVSALADALIVLIDNPNLRTRIGEAAHQRISQEFTIDQSVNKISLLYDRLLIDSRSLG